MEKLAELQNNFPSEASTENPSAAASMREKHLPTRRAGRESAVTGFGRANSMFRFVDEKFQTGKNETKKARWRRKHEQDKGTHSPKGSGGTRGSKLEILQGKEQGDPGRGKRRWGSPDPSSLTYLHLGRTATSLEKGEKPMAEGVVPYSHHEKVYKNNFLSTKTVAF